MEVGVVRCERANSSKTSSAPSCNSISLPAIESIISLIELSYLFLASAISLSAFADNIAFALLISSIEEKFFARAAAKV